MLNKYLERYQRDFEKARAGFSQLPKELIFHLAGTGFSVQLDWRGIETLLHERLTELGLPPKPLIGGLKDQAFGASQSASDDTLALVSVNPGFILVRLQAAFKADSGAALWKLTSQLLAHELGHVLQNNRGYGWIGYCIDWSRWASIIGVLSAILALEGVGSWLVPAVSLAYSALMYAAYYWHPLEVDARQYARQYWHEWARYVRVERLDG